MAEKKRKTRDDTKRKAGKFNKKIKGKSHMRSQKKKTGPRLPNAFRKELDRLNPIQNDFEGEDVDILSDVEVNDVYEYEEGMAEEESKKNRRYDRVDNYEYQLPDNFKDENVQSDDDDDDDDEYEAKDSKRKKLELSDDDADGESDERHLRMLKGITGMPTEAFDGTNKKKKKNAVIEEVYPESEFNPSCDVLHGDGRISIDDLLESLQGKSVYSELRKRTSQMEKKTAALHAPLPKQVQDKLEREEAYKLAKKDITKWEPLVKRNREAPTIIFDRDIDLGFSTVGAIASEFEPRTEFEKKMASLVHDDKVVEAHKEDGARLLELNKVSEEDIKEKWNYIAKMRSLLFRHEVKLKRVKKIKSKVYRRLLKKDRLKGSFDLDPEDAKEQSEKQLRERALERMTLKHKNTSKFAKRAIKRGLHNQDDGTRAALAEQLHQHALLTRKMKSMRDSSSDDSSDDDGASSAGSDEDGQLKILTKGKDKTLKVLEEDDEVPNSGVLSLPFMVRGLKKKKEEADEEAKRTLQEYESSINQLKDSGEADAKVGYVSGRRVFGPSKTQDIEPKQKIRLKDSNGSSDCEDELDNEEDDIGLSEMIDIHKDVNVSSHMPSKDSGYQRDSMNLDEFVGDKAVKPTYELALFASGAWRKMKGENEADTITKRTSKVAEPSVQSPGLEMVSEDGDTDGEGQMVDGILSSSPKSSYRLPSQEELIREAFAGDDVEEEFAKDKEELLNEENPEPEKPTLLPGWGQWTHVQKKKGIPSWMKEEHEIAKGRREEALKRRKDARLKHVIISEKLDKKAEKLHTKTLPFPFTSKEVFEHSMRIPIGPESNPATAVGALTRPEVVKKSGLIIKPIRYEDVDLNEREERKSNGEKKKKQKQKSRIRNQVKPVVAKS